MSYEISFYIENRNECPILDFLEGLSVKEAQKCLIYLELLAEFGNKLPSSHIKHIEGDLWELRPEFGGTEFRLFYFIVLADTILVVHAVKKKGRKLPRREIELALKRAEEVRPNG